MYLWKSKHTQKIIIYLYNVLYLNLLSIYKCSVLLLHSHINHLFLQITSKAFLLRNNSPQQNNQWIISQNNSSFYCNNNKATCNKYFMKTRFISLHLEQFYLKFLIVFLLSNAVFALNRYLILLNIFILWFYLPVNL